ncbi:MAG: immunoglobulin domain-containing family protein [Planctomycetota bacterium]|jgi:hypothetical protein
MRRRPAPPPPGPAAPAILTQPADVTATEGDWVTFTVDADGAGLEYEWQGSPDGGTSWYALPYGDASLYLLMGVHLADDGLLFRCIVSNAGGEVTSGTALLTVQPVGAGMAAPVITTQPADVTAYVGGWATFTVAATGESLSYQWEVSLDDGATWVPLAGEEWDSYLVDGVEQGDFGLRFRCVVTNMGGSATSDAATLISRVIYVHPGATFGANDGSTWANAFLDLQDALAAATTGQEIWVAADTYYATQGADRTATFQLKSGVNIYGGFAGGESELAERDYLTNVTTLSGDIGTAADASDNSYHVVTGADGAALDGFTITAGNADGTAPWNKGGYVAGCSYVGSLSSSAGESRKAA